MKRILIPIWVILCVQLNTYSQESLSPEISVTPPSPEVIAMNKFTEIPVSYYTGLPQISIPIHTIQMKKITVPISLDYHASGLRVDEYASWVGAGWSLSGAGAISRTIRGRADERDETPDYKGYFYSSNWLDSNGNLVNSVFSDCSLDRQFSVPATFPEYSPLNSIDYIATGIWDTQPDSYNYSYPGGGGKFIFNHLRDLILLTPDDVSINDPFDILSSNMYLTAYDWSITGPDGTQYIYENKAETTFSSNPCASIGYEEIPMPDLTVNQDQTSWFLTKIKNGSEWIEYSYSDILTVTDSVKINETARVKITGDGTSVKTTCKSIRTRNTYLLSSITTSNGYTINFVTGGQRNDLDGSAILTKITVSYLGQLIRTIDLNNDGYFGTNTKLKLDGVEFQDANGVTVEKYDLDYYPGTFPDMQTPQQDYWGYYNGVTFNNNSLIPEWWDADYHININSGVSREPSLDHAKIGSLQKITYPTGGTATFDYELHDHSGANTETQFSYYVEADGDPTNTVTDSELFTVTHDCSVSMIYGPIPEGIDAFAELRKKNPSTQVYEPYTPSDRVGFDYYATAYRKNLEAGDYMLYAESSGDPIELEIKFEQTAVVDFQVAGGLRIKKISNHDPVTDSTAHTIFNYTVDGEDRSSGVLLSNPLHDGYFTQYIPGSNINGNCSPSINVFEWDVWVNVASYAQIPLGSVQGSHVGYSTVNVIKVTDEQLASYSPGPSVNYRPEYSVWPDNLSSIGKQSFHYINDTPTSGVGEYNTNYPFIPFPDLDYKNGQLVAQKTYKNVNGSNVLQHEILNSYDTLETDTLTSYTFTRTTSTFCYTCSRDYNDGNVYSDRGRKTRLTQTIDRSYENGNSRDIVTNYEYDYPNHHQLAATSTTESDGDIRKVVYKRNPVYPAFTTRMDKLVDGTIISSDSLRYVDQLPTHYYKWSQDNSESDTYNPSVYKWQTPATYELKTRIHRDTEGLIAFTEQPPINGGPPILTTYLYSYGNGEKPVAEIKNLDSTQVDAKLAQIDATYSRAWLKTNTDESQIRSALTALQNALEPNEPMTIYLYESESIAYGPSEIIDPNGVKQKFKYDSYGRLEHVYDQDGNLVKKITYNLKNN